MNFFNHRATYFLLPIGKSDTINFEENNARKDFKCYKTS